VSYLSHALLVLCDEFTYGRFCCRRIFLFSAPTDGVYSFDTCGSKFDTLLSIAPADNPQETLKANDTMACGWSAGARLCRMGWLLRLRLHSPIG
jgi:hypothetical protein